MKKYILLLIMLMLGRAMFGQELMKESNAAFQPGEHLHYKLKYGLITAAEADLRVENATQKFEGRQAYHIVADGKTSGAFNVFFKVRNRYESYIDCNTLLPYQYIENRKEGNYRHSDNVVFNHETHKITAAKGVYPFSGQMFDFPSAYYFARCLDVTKIKVGEKLAFHYFLEDTTQTLTITYVGKETVSCSMGKFDCLKFNPTIVPGNIFRKDSKLYLWISNDRNRIPVKAQVEVVVGSITMDLTDAQGLKYPLNQQ